MPLMKPIKYITPNFAVTGALGAADMAEAAAMGFKGVISNLPDGELSAAPSSSEEADLAKAAGLAFRHIPATKFDVLSERVVDATVEALSAFGTPVLAHCASGMRSAVAWAAAAARSQDEDCVLAALKDAGFELAALKDELAAQRRNDAPAPIPALDAGCKQRANTSK
jgi:sulfide:quinone oxidoreductase